MVQINGVKTASSRVDGWPRPVGKHLFPDRESGPPRTPDLDRLICTENPDGDVAYGNTQPRGFPSMLVGYMRVSSDSDRQTTDPQRDALLSAGVDSRHLTNLAAGDTVLALPVLGCCLSISGPALPSSLRSTLDASQSRTWRGAGRSLLRELRDHVPFERLVVRDRGLAVVGPSEQDREGELCGSRVVVSPAEAVR